MTSKHLRNSSFLFLQQPLMAASGHYLMVDSEYICYILTKYFFFPGNAARCVNVARALLRIPFRSGDRST